MILSGSQGSTKYLKIFSIKDPLSLQFGQVKCQKQAQSVSKALQTSIPILPKDLTKLSNLYCGLLCFGLINGQWSSETAGLCKIIQNGP